MSESSGLTGFQRHVASVFFSLPASSGFVLAGGAALLANNLTQRPTQDLDFFRATPDVRAAADAFESELAVLGYKVARLRDLETFVRLQVDGDRASSSICASTRLRSGRP